MDEVETRKTLVEKAIEMGIPKGLLKNLNSGSIKKIVEYEKEIKKDKDATREIPGYRT